MNVPKTLEKVSNCAYYVDWEGVICHNDVLSCIFRLSYCKENKRFFAMIRIAAGGDMKLEREQEVEPFDYLLATSIIPKEDKEEYIGDSINEYLDNQT